MKKFIIFLFMVLVVFLVMAFSMSCEAIEKPQYYNQPDSFLVSYMSTFPDTETKIIKALNIIDIMYPNWQDNYKYGIFDCSEMTEFVWYFFNKCGIESTYCQSNTLWHCWLEVKDNNKNIIIETTTLSIVSEENAGWYYSGRDVKYNRHMRIDEIDWWNSKIFNGSLLSSDLRYR
ncbi:hypothetical protein Psfp_02945 [Pelotomaculum sp. FP]|uniref:hypothetical protein n=1 Tax=Pelotomaculum sp. FP TaxID=261474 RepID=UPI00106525D7|nr:hypothetical protein [Pelotomaculum sp. FP]TEB14442.1 hypothetical protein Psfp_02945 [Pelotomaculum sp. FP]